MFKEEQFASKLLEMYLINGVTFENIDAYFILEHGKTEEVLKYYNAADVSLRGKYRKSGVRVDRHTILKVTITIIEFFVTKKKVNEGFEEFLKAAWHDGRLDKDSIEFVQEFNITWVVIAVVGFIVALAISLMFILTQLNNISDDVSIVKDDNLYFIGYSRKDKVKAVGECYFEELDSNTRGIGVFSTFGNTVFKFKDNTYAIVNTDTDIKFGKFKNNKLYSGVYLTKIDGNALDLSDIESYGLDAQDLYLLYIVEKGKYSEYKLMLESTTGGIYYILNEKNEFIGYIGNYNPMSSIDEFTFLWLDDLSTDKHTQFDKITYDEESFCFNLGNGVLLSASDNTLVLDPSYTGIALLFSEATDRMSYANITSDDWDIKVKPSKLQFGDKTSAMIQRIGTQVVCEWERNGKLSNMTVDISR